MQRICALNPKRGFSLIELLVVLLIVSGLGLIGVTALQPGLARADFVEQTASVQQSLRRARTQSLRLGKAVVWQVRSHKIWVGEEMVAALQPGLTLLGVPAETPTVVFFPDGSSSGASLLAEQGQRHLKITVDWLTGRIDA